MSFEQTRPTMVLVAVLALLVVVGAPAVLAADAGDAGDAPVGDELTSSHAGASATDATMRVESASANASETVTVQVAVSGESIAGYQANLTWDPTVLRYESAEGVDLSDPVTNDGDGWVFMTQSQTDGVSSPTVAAVTFRVVGDPGDETALSFVRGDSSVNNESTQLATALESGTITVAGDGAGDDADVGADAVDDAENGSDDGTGSDGADDAGDGDGAGADGSTDAAGSGEDGLSPVLVVLGLVGAGVVLGTGYALGQRTAGDDGDD